MGVNDPFSGMSVHLVKQEWLGLIESFQLDEVVLSLQKFVRPWDRLSLGWILD